jgi:hypothetical protein
MEAAPNLSWLSAPDHDRGHAVYSVNPTLGFDL